MKRGTKLLYKKIFAGLLGGGMLFMPKTTACRFYPQLHSGISPRQVSLHNPAAENNHWASHILHLRPNRPDYGADRSF